jgi:hypothetical protein
MATGTVAIVILVRRVLGSQGSSGIAIKQLGMLIQTFSPSEITDHPKSRWQNATMPGDFPLASLPAL